MSFLIFFVSVSTLIEKPCRKNVIKVSYYYHKRTECATINAHKMRKSSIMSQRIPAK